MLHVCMSQMRDARPASASAHSSAEQTHDQNNCNARHSEEVSTKDWKRSPSLPFIVQLHWGSRSPLLRDFTNTRDTASPQRPVAAAAATLTASTLSCQQRHLADAQHLTVPPSVRQSRHQHQQQHPRWPRRQPSSRSRRVTLDARHLDSILFIRQSIQHHAHCRVKARANSPSRLG